MRDLCVRDLCVRDLCETCVRDLGETCLLGLGAAAKHTKRERREETPWKRGGGVEEVGRQGGQQVGTR